MTNVLTRDRAVEITKREDGRTQIVFRKSILKGKCSSADVLNVIFVAARMQAEKYVEKLSRGSPLDTSEVRALKELADITKLELIGPIQKQDTVDMAEVDEVKESLYKALNSRFEPIINNNN